LVRLLKKSMRQKKRQFNYREISIVVHSLIGIAEALIHTNTCKDCHSCEAIRKARLQLYELREDVLKMIEKED